MSGEFDYGNARLRAMKSHLLDRRVYEGLLGKTLNGLIAALAATAYHQDVEASLARLSGLACLHDVLRKNLGRTLLKVRSVYAGEARDGVDLLLARFDLANLLTILRGQAREAPVDAVLALLVPSGTFDDATLKELVRQPGLRPAIDLLRGWDLPRPEVARALVAAWPTYERSRDLGVLEHAASRAFAERADETLARGIVGAEILARVIRPETDKTNVLVALRGREARVRGEKPPQDRNEDPFPGGSLSPRVLLGIARAASREEVAAALATIHGWREPLAHWVTTGDLAALESEIEVLLKRDAGRLCLAEDPLSMAVPIAYLAAKDTEVRNLRLIGWAAANEVAQELVREDLVYLQ